MDQPATAIHSRSPVESRRPSESPFVHLRYAALDAHPPCP